MGKKKDDKKLKKKRLKKLSTKGAVVLGKVKNKCCLKYKKKESKRCKKCPSFDLLRKLK